MTSLGWIPQADPPHPSASLACSWKGVLIVMAVHQVVIIYSVLALTFGNHYLRDRRPKKKKKTNLGSQVFAELRGKGQKEA